MIGTYQNTDKFLDMSPAGLQRIFFVWYPNFLPTKSNKVWDCLYTKCYKKAEVKTSKTSRGWGPSFLRGGRDYLYYRTLAASEYLKYILQ